MESTSNELSPREKVSFEIGIKLGAIFHQFIGTPVSEKTKSSLEKSIEKSISNQPFVKDVKIKIDLKEEDTYSSLSPQEINAMVKIEVKNTVGVGRLEYKDGYPLMWVESMTSSSS